MVWVALKTVMMKVKCHKPFVTYLPYSPSFSMRGIELQFVSFINCLINCRHFLMIVTIGPLKSLLYATDLRGN